MIENVKQIAREAGAILMKYYKQDLDVISKSKDHFNPVTQADREADAFIREQLHKAFPKDQILSEESADIPADYSGRVWMVDPLDGTRSFIEHAQGFSVIIGLCVRGIPLLGVIYIPTSDELYYAEKGKGAFREADGRSKRIHVSTTGSLANSTFLVSLHYKDSHPYGYVTGKLKVGRMLPIASCGTKICLIARGAADLYINGSDGVSKWDSCGAQVILKEAGGIMTDIEGNPLDYRQQQTNWKKTLIASNGILQKEFVTEIQKVI